MKRSSAFIYCAVLMASLPLAHVSADPATVAGPENEDPFALLAPPAELANGDSQLSDLPLEELMNVRIDLASLRSETVLEAPATVTVVSRQEILQYGARDLADILQLVPGFQFAFDVGSSVGAGFRGLWVHEGKMLVMIDGVQVNDLAYGAVAYFGTFPAEMIDHVEIVRGPGSAIYGGVAEGGVINVVTSTGAQLNGVRAQGSLGRMNYATTKSGNLSAGVKTDTLDVSAHIGLMATPLTVREYRDSFGNALAGGYDSLGRWWNHAIVKAVYRDALTIKYEKIRFRWQGQDGYVRIVPALSGGLQSENYVYDQEGVQFQYKAQVGSKLRLEPTLEYLTGAPMEAAIYPASIIEGQFDGAWNTMRRYRAELLGRYDFAYGTQLLLGGGHILTSAEAVTSDGQPGLYLDASALAFSRETKATYGLAQLSHRLGPFGFTLGVRYENTTFGNAYAPRLGITYADDVWNLKLLYGEGYRIPLPFQAYSRWFNVISSGIRPEHFRSGEFEVGRKVARTLHLKANFFWMALDDAIVYLGNSNAYQNFGGFRDYGVEVEGRLANRDYGGFASLSAIQPFGGTSDSYLTTDRGHVLSMASWIGSAGAYYKLGNFTFGPTLVYLSTRYGQSESSAISTATGGTTLGNNSYPGIWMLNLGVTWKDVFEHVTARLSGHNLLGSDYLLIQNTYGSHAPLPAQDRQVALHLDIDLL